MGNLSRRATLINKTLRIEGAQLEKHRSGLLMFSSWHLSKKGETAMDFKKLSLFIIGVGVVVFALGAIWYLTNMPVQNPGGFRGLIEAHDENLRRSAQTSSANWTMVFGAIAALAGIGIRASAKKDGDRRAE
jgi:hypothetical protein